MDGQLVSQLAFFSIEVTLFFDAMLREEIAGRDTF